MKTKCYCVGCKRHPLHSKRKEFKKWLTGYSPDSLIVTNEYENQAAIVDCLKPTSGADEYVDLDDFDYPVTAYGDGAAITGCDLPGLIIYANCGNEDHED